MTERQSPRYESMKCSIVVPLSGEEFGALEEALSEVLGSSDKTRQLAQASAESIAMWRSLRPGQEARAKPIDIRKAAQVVQERTAALIQSIHQVPELREMLEQELLMRRIDPQNPQRIELRDLELMLESLRLAARTWELRAPPRKRRSRRGAFLAEPFVELWRELFPKHAELSESRGSYFHRALTCVYEAAGETASPTNDIRILKDQRAARPTRE